MKRTACILSMISLLFNFQTAMGQDTVKTKEFKPSGKLWGLAFGDVYMKLLADSLNRNSANQYYNVPVNGNAFEFRRIYLGYDHDIAPKFSSELLIAYEGQTLTDAQTRTVFLKAANVKWKNILPNNDLVFGLVSAPCFAAFTDKLWGYRSIEKSIADMRKASSAFDAGLQLQGKFDANGNFGYFLMLGNGSGIKIEGDIFKKMYGEFYAKLMKGHLVFDLYGDYERTKLLPNYHKNKMTEKFTVSYQSDAVNIGLEIMAQSHTNNAIRTDTAGKTDTVSTMMFGLSFYAKARIIKEKLAFFIRFDTYDPDMNFDKELSYSPAYTLQNTEIFLTAGFDYTPVKNVHVMPNVWYDGYMNRTKNATGKFASDNDLVARLTLYYQFK